MSSPAFRPATPEDLDALLPVVRQFYDHFGFAWDEPRKRALLAELIADPQGRKVPVGDDALARGASIVTLTGGTCAVTSIMPSCARYRRANETHRCLCAPTAVLAL